MHTNVNQQELVIRLVIEQPGTGPAVVPSQARIVPEASGASSPQGLTLESVPFKTRNFSSDDTIYKQGDTADTVLFVDRGTAKTFIASKIGQQAGVRILRKGDIVSELALINNVRYNTAVAMEDTIVREYDVDSIWGYLADNQIATEITKSLLARIEQMVKERSDSPVSTKDKLIGALLQIAERDGHKTAGGGVLIRQRYTHEMLAGMIGARRETVTIYLQELRKAGAFERRGKTMFLQLEALRREQS
jgi:CRP-like cAMP-binding protein